MSYCVNCGVELDKTCSVCPLCNTKVINPNQPVDTVSPKPYPVDKGYVDSGIRKETAILMAVCLAATAVVCGLLNLFLSHFPTGPSMSSAPVSSCGFSVSMQEVME